jgi:hypothetical protein
LIKYKQQRNVDASSPNTNSGPAFIQVQFFYVNKTDPTQWYQLYQENKMPLSSYAICNKNTKVQASAGY